MDFYFKAGMGNLGYFELLNDYHEITFIICLLDLYFTCLLEA